MWRLEARDTPPFLVDQHRCMCIPDYVAQRGNQRPHLLRIMDIAREKDESPRLRLAKKRALLCREFEPGAAIDRACSH